MNAYTSTHSKNPSVLVCFAGKLRRIDIDAKKCKRNLDPVPTFTTNINYKDENDKVYRVRVESIKGIGYPTKCNVFVYNGNGQKLLAKRENVDLRFGKNIFV